MLNIYWEMCTATSDVVVPYQCCVANVPCHLPMLHNQSIQALADAAFHWMTQISPCRCAHAMADTCSTMLILHVVDWCRLPDANMLRLCMEALSDSTCPWPTLLAGYTYFTFMLVELGWDYMILVDVPFKIPIYNVRCMQSLADTTNP